MSVDGIGREKIVSIEMLRRLRAAAAAPDANGSATAGSSRAEGVPRGGGPLSAQERRRLLTQFKSETAELPEVRSEKVIAAKLRLSTGYYNRPEVRRELLRSVLADLLPPPHGAPPAPGPGKAASAAPSDPTAGKATPAAASDAAPEPSPADDRRGPPAAAPPVPADGA